MDELRILPKELKRKIDNNEDFFLLDVRNLNEYETAKLKGAVLIPLPQLESEINNIPKNKEIIVYCHHGNRSLEAARILKKYSLNVKSLVGGIDVWSRLIDPSVSQY